MHTRKDPGDAEPVTIVRVSEVAEPKEDDVLETPEEGVPEHVEPEVITNARKSAATLRSPAPASTTSWPADEIEMTFGVSEVAEKISKAPASKYGDNEVHRVHSRYTPAVELNAFIVTEIDAPDPVLVLDVLDTIVGDVLEGEEHDAAMTKELTSVETVGMKAPPTETSWFADAGIPGGLTVEMVAAK